MGKLAGVFGGLIFFLVILFLMLYPNSDFDNKLVTMVDSGVSADKLIPMIEKKSINENLKAKKHLEGHIMDKKHWYGYNISPESDLNYEITLYKEQIEAISKLKELRKKYAKREISKEEFQEKIRIYKFIIHE